MTEPQPEASGEGLTWARVPRGHEPLRQRVAQLLDAVPLSTVTKFMITAYELAAGREGTRPLGGRTLAPRVSGQSIRVWSVDSGETDLLRADVTVRVARARGTRTDPIVVTVAFVWSGRRVIAVGEPRAVDREWVALGAPAVLALEGLAAANRDRLGRLLDFVLTRARGLPDGGWTELAHDDGLWPTRPVATALWLSAPTLEGHRMAEALFDDPALTVKLLIDAAADAAAPPTPHVLELGQAWQQPLWPHEPPDDEADVRPGSADTGGSPTHGEAPAHSGPGATFTEEARSRSAAAPTPSTGPGPTGASPQARLIRTLVVAVAVLVIAVIVLAFMLLGA